MRRLAALVLALAGVAAPVRSDVALRHVPTGAPCPPILLLSHGFGGTEAAFAQLADRTAALGFDTWIMGHSMSGPAAFRAINRSGNRRMALAEAITDPAMHQERADDIGEALRVARADRTCEPPLMVLGGHSIGAHTTMVEAGGHNRFGTRGYDRFDAYIALSPQGVGLLFAPNSWGDIKKPVLVVTGTRDGSMDGAYWGRIAAFEGLPPLGHDWFALINGATHMDVGTLRNTPEGEASRQIVLDFLSGLMKGDVDLRDRPGVIIRRR